ncbi:hypothetical protein ESCO_002311 [Escovopsis weberi]|uniref:Vegetative incompatibility protein HET-E-1 n=1 Tax=Escovopsis weberi TaxID=150374 RepID=A0A0M8N0A0_ESCWE|nr:hypothetical protein ESCO_002311 [Escovopsis weberi]
MLALATSDVTLPAFTRCDSMQRRVEERKTASLPAPPPFESSSSYARGIEARFAAIVSDAAKQYAGSSAAKAGRSALEELLDPPLRSLNDLIQQLAIHNAHFVHFRARRQAIINVVSAALEPVEVLGDLVSGASEDAFPPAHYIFGAVMYLVKAAHDVSSTYDSIIELFTKLKDFTSRLDIYVKHALTPALRGKLVSILTVLFEVIIISTHAARQGRVRAYLRRLIAPGNPAQGALKRLNALTLSEERQVIAETYGGVSEITVKTDQVQEMVSQVSQSILEMNLERRAMKAVSHRDQLMDILEPTPFAEDYYTTFSKGRIPGTGEWLLEDEGLQAWIRGETRHLWICGNPGTGKSFLTSKLIAWGLENLPQLAYFFFRDNDPETRSVLQALRDIAYQLTESDAYYAERLIRDLHSKDDIKTIASAYRRLFVHPFAGDMRERSSAYILLDGIDEADQDEINELLSLLVPDDDGPMTASGHWLQFGLTGRTYMSENVAALLDPDGRGRVVTTVHVTQERSAADVLAFIKDGVRHSRVLSRLTDQFQREIVQAMAGKVDGLFILAKFMLTEVNGKRHPSSILRSLETFPKELDGMLTKAMADLTATLSDEEIRDLNEMLQWVACAEESLTLEQLEAAMVLVFGDSPLRLEEALRGQFACFFELERADGLTTDDLVKEFARLQRETDPETSPGKVAGPHKVLTAPSQDSPVRSASPSPAQSADSRACTPRSPDPGRRYSASPGVILPDLTREMEFRSPSGTKVKFPHTSIRQFFRQTSGFTDPEQQQSATLGFSIVAARVHILKVCLKIFVDKAWFEKQKLGGGKEAMKQYAAWYWQEHLAVLDPGTVLVEDRRQLAMQIYSMLNDEDILFDWSIMYEKNDEGLELLTDSNIAALRKWIHDPVVYDSLSPEAKLRVSNAKETKLGICEPIGRFYAKAWLSEDCHVYVPTLFCFNIVQSIALMDAGRTWSQATASGKGISIRDRMARAIEWASFLKTAHWNLRVGSTHVMLGLYGNALDYYNEALEMDPDNFEISGRIAFCLSQYGRYDEALDQALECAAAEKKRLSDGQLQGYSLESCKWRLYKDYLLIGRCYYRLGDVDPSREYYERAVESAASAGLGASEYLEAETEYIRMLAAENLDEELMKLLMGMAMQTTNRNARPGTSRLTELLLKHYSQALVTDWIPKVACKSREAEWAFTQVETAIDAAQRDRDPTAVLYLRIAYGSTLLYNRDIDGAIELFERISLEQYRPKGNIPTRQGHAISFQKLAQLYKSKVLQFDITSEEAQKWIGKMEAIQRKQNEHRNLDMPPDMLGSDVNIASIYLASLYATLGRTLEANTLLRKLVLGNLDILVDDEPRNDEYALENLLRAFIASNDISNALALAQSMRKVNPRAPAPDPLDSPVETLIEPKLPDIQSNDRSCSQCLNNIVPWEEFVLCRFCLDSYCVGCLDGIIRVPGNKTSDGRADVICRSDHDWFTVPPLDRPLHRGEILWEDGQVKVFTEWESGLRRRWGMIAHEDSSKGASFWLI